MTEVNQIHALDVETVREVFGTDIEVGLSSPMARERLEQYGPNTLLDRDQRPWYVLLLRQFNDSMTVVLAVAATLSIAIGDVADSIAILAILVLNALFGFAQEWKAENAVQALRGMLLPICVVVRDGLTRQIRVEEVVPGDIVELETGSRVAADLRLVQSFNLRIDESALTGESAAAEKGTRPVDSQSAVAERRNMAWMGTTVAEGRGRGIAAATGGNTEFGRIARLTANVHPESTPLERKLRRLSRNLAVLGGGISVSIGIVGWLSGKPPIQMLLTAVSVAVAVVPEGLPAVVTLTLAIGLRTMAAKRALIRRLKAAETLGSTTVICTDKTGTLTRGEMAVHDVWLPSGSDPTEVLRSAALCNHAHVYLKGDRWEAIGSPTEAALMIAAREAGIDDSAGTIVVAEFPFTSERKRMTVVIERDGVLTAHVKGAPGIVLDRSGRILDTGRVRPIAAHDRERIDKIRRQFADSGFRTLAVARRLLVDTGIEESSVEQGLTFLGLVAISDPPRPEVAEALQTAAEAGIRVIMITGDSPRTAMSIAREIGLKVDRAVSGPEIDGMSLEDLAQVLRGDVLFARSTPEHKLRIVKALQNQGHVVAMTGDGVNDTPALRQADIGIGMGIRGTDAARQAADMVLADDNFASIIAAIREGRRQFDNIQKFIHYLLSSNAAELVAIAGNILIGGPLILLPVQILWMNLITDSVTAIALGLEPVSPGAMQRPPRPPGEPIITRRGTLTILLLGGYMGLAALTLFHTFAVADVILAQTLAFTGLIVMEKVNVFNFRSMRETLGRIGWFSNPWLLAAWCGAIGFQILAIHTGTLSALLHTTSLAWRHWAVLLVLALPTVVFMETSKRIWTGKCKCSS